MQQKIALPVLLLALAVGIAFAQEPGSAASEAYQRIETGVARLGDGKNTAYGLYLAGARSKKYVYMISMNSLTVGLEVKMEVTSLDGKTREVEAEKLRTDEALDIAIYTLKMSTKEGAPITRHPDLEQAQRADAWTLGPAGSPQALVTLQPTGLAADGRTFNATGDITALIAGAPVFDTGGKMLGILTSQNSDGSYRTIAIGALLDFASKAFAAEALDLYPTWNEVYPSQYAIERIRASAAVLETSKPGTGFFLGRDKNGAGYLLTANHVIEQDEEFSVNFAGYEESGIIGKPLAGATDAALDLAVVIIEEECPPVKPVIFWSPKDFNKLKKNFADSTEAVASIGRSQSLDDYFQSKKGFIRGENLEGQFLQTDLQLESGDSGGPLFNKNGEVVAINLKTALQESNFSVANNIETVLEFLDEKLDKVDFAVKWEFLQKPSYWARNKNWMLPLGAAATAGAAAVILSQKPPEKLASIDAVGLPPSGQKR